MTTLYQIDEQINELLNTAEINEETGEIFVDFEKLNKLSMEKDKKIENIIRYYKDLIGDVDKFDAEIAVLTNVKKVIENKAESLKRYLDSSLPEKIYVDKKGETKSKKYEYGIHTITWRKSEKVVPDNDTDPIGCTPLKFIKKKEIVEADKTAIKDAIKAGEKVSGWSIQNNQNIQIK